MPGPAEAAAARAQKRKFDSRCSDAHCRIEESEVPQPAAASTRPDDDDDHNAAASTTTTRRRRRVTSQSQVSDAGGRVAEHDDG